LHIRIVNGRNVGGVLIGEGLARPHNGGRRQGPECGPAIIGACAATVSILPPWMLVRVAVAVPTSDREEARACPQSVPDEANSYFPDTPASPRSSIADHTD
jgi:hypothetical protein